MLRSVDCVALVELMKPVEKRKSTSEIREGFEAKRTATALDADKSHIPAFVSKTPWYLSKDKAENKADLSHQKSTSSFAPSESFNIGIKKGTVGDVKTKFVAGACENCGSTSHKRKDCLERPRKVLAKYTNEKLASDDVVPVELGRSSFEAKRDRWSNFIAEDYREKLADEGNYDDVPSRAGNKLMFTAGDTESLSVANLRVREDTAKYLLDLSGEGAHYDPKSRSMREVGDQFQRYSGEAEEMMKVRRQMAWDRSQTNEVSNPTEIALKLKREREEKKAILEKRRLELDTKYNS